MTKRLRRKRARKIETGCYKVTLHWGHREHFAQSCCHWLRYSITESLTGGLTSTEQRRARPGVLVSSVLGVIGDEDFISRVVVLESEKITAPQKSAQSSLDLELPCWSVCGILPLELSHEVFYLKRHSMKSYMWWSLLSRQCELIFSLAQDWSLSFEFCWLFKIFCNTNSGGEAPWTKLCETVSPNLCQQAVQWRLGPSQLVHPYGVDSSLGHNDWAVVHDQHPYWCDVDIFVI